MEEEIKQLLALQKEANRHLKAISGNVRALLFIQVILILLALAVAVSIKNAAM